jgi:MFS family permease
MQVSEELSRPPVTASHRQQTIWLVFVALGALVVSLSQSILIPVLAQIPVLLSTSAEATQWMLTITLLVGAIAVPLMGRLGDMFGKKLLLVIALGSLVAGSLVSAVSNDIVTQIVGRGIQGVGLGAIPLGISLLATLLPRERSGSAVALISAMLGVGGALGLPTAGLIAQALDFHALFWITGAAGLVAFIGVLVLVPESGSPSGGHVDIFGALLLSAALISLLLPLSQANKWGWGSFAVIGLLVLAAVLIVVFGWWQTRSTSPIVDLASLRRHPIIFTNIASLLFGFALFASLIGTANYVQAPEASGYGFGSTPLVAGLTLLPSGLAMLVLSPVAAKLVARIGAHVTLAIGSAVIALGWVMRIFVHDQLWQIIVGATVVGIGTGIGYAAMPSLINTYTPKSELASANSINSLVRSLGSSLASAVGGTILASLTTSLGAHVLPSLAAYRLLFVMCAAAAVLSLILALLIPGRGRRDVTV